MAREETDEQAEMRRRLQRHATARKRQVEQEADLIREAIAAGMRRDDIAHYLERSREHLRLTLDPSKRKTTKREQ